MLIDTVLEFETTEKLITEQINTSFPILVLGKRMDASCSVRRSKDCAINAKQNYVWTTHANIWDSYLCWLATLHWNWSFEGRRTIFTLRPEVEMWSIDNCWFINNAINVDARVIVWNRWKICCLSLGHRFFCPPTTNALPIIIGLTVKGFVIYW